MMGLDLGVLVLLTLLGSMAERGRINVKPLRNAGNDHPAVVEDVALGRGNKRTPSSGRGVLLIDSDDVVQRAGGVAGVSRV